MSDRLPGVAYATDAGRRRGRAWTVLAGVEVALGAAAVVLDLWLPTLVLLVLAGLSLLVRREGLGTLGLVRPQGVPRLFVTVLGLIVLWTLVQLALIIPTLEHLSGTRQDLSMFDDLQGDLPLLVVLIVASWTLAAFGEELVYRGYLQVRLADVLGSSTAATVAVIVFTSALFGLAHTEQGVVGVGATFLDGLFFSALARWSSSGVWAAVLAHGLNNTIGLTAYYLVGPIYGLW